MTDKVNLKHEKFPQPQEGTSGAQVEDSSGARLGNKSGSSDSRRPALSKREMMEELSRARFPWEE